MLVCLNQRNSSTCPINLSFSMVVYHASFICFIYFKEYMSIVSHYLISQTLKLITYFTFPHACPMQYKLPKEHKFKNARTFGCIPS